MGKEESFVLTKMVILLIPFSMTIIPRISITHMEFETVSVLTLTLLPVVCGIQKMVEQLGTKSIWLNPASTAVGVKYREYGLRIESIPICHPQNQKKPARKTPKT